MPSPLSFVFLQCLYLSGASLASAIPARGHDVDHNADDDRKAAILDRTIMASGDSTTLHRLTYPYTFRRILVGARTQAWISTPSKRASSDLDHRQIPEVLLLGPGYKTYGGGSADNGRNLGGARGGQGREGQEGRYNVDSPRQGISGGRQNTGGGLRRSGSGGVGGGGGIGRGGGEVAEVWTPEDIQKLYPFLNRGQGLTNNGLGFQDYGGNDQRRGEGTNIIDTGRSTNSDVYGFQDNRPTDFDNYLNDRNRDYQGFGGDRGGGQTGEPGRVNVYGFNQGQEQGPGDTQPDPWYGSVDQDQTTGRQQGSGYQQFDPWYGPVNQDPARGPTGHGYQQFDPWYGSVNQDLTTGRQQGSGFQQPDPWYGPVNQDPTRGRQQSFGNQFDPWYGHVGQDTPGGRQQGSGGQQFDPWYGPVNQDPTSGRQQGSGNQQPDPWFGQVNQQPDRQEIVSGRETVGLFGGGRDKQLSEATPEELSAFMEQRNRILGNVLDNAFTSMGIGMENDVPTDQKSSGNQNQINNNFDTPSSYPDQDQITNRLIGPKQSTKQFSAPNQNQNQNYPGVPSNLDQNGNRFIRQNQIQQQKPTPYPTPVYQSTDQNINQFFGYNQQQNSTPNPTPYSPYHNQNKSSFGRKSPFQNFYRNQNGEKPVEDLNENEETVRFLQQNSNQNSDNDFNSSKVPPNMDKIQNFYQFSQRNNFQNNNQNTSSGHVHSVNQTAKKTPSQIPNQTANQIPPLKNRNPFYAMSQLRRQNRNKNQNSFPHTSVYKWDSISNAAQRDGGENNRRNFDPLRSFMTYSADLKANQFSRHTQDLDSDWVDKYPRSEHHPVTNSPTIQNLKPPRSTDPPHRNFPPVTKSPSPPVSQSKSPFRPWPKRGKRSVEDDSDRPPSKDLHHIKPLTGKLEIPKRPIDATSEENDETSLARNSENERTSPQETLDSEGTSLERDLDKEEEIPNSEQDSFRENLDPEETEDAELTSSESTDKMTEVTEDDPLSLSQAASSGGSGYAPGSPYGPNPPNDNPYSSSDQSGTRWWERPPGNYGNVGTINDGFQGYRNTKLGGYQSYSNVETPNSGYQSYGTMNSGYQGYGNTRATSGPYQSDRNAGPTNHQYQTYTDSRNTNSGYQDYRNTGTMNSGYQNYGNAGTTSNGYQNFKTSGSPNTGYQNYGNAGTINSGYQNYKNTGTPNTGYQNYRNKGVMNNSFQKYKGPRSRTQSYPGTSRVDDGYRRMMMHANYQGGGMFPSNYGNSGVMYTSNPYGSTSIYGNSVMMHNPYGGSGGYGDRLMMTGGYGDRHMMTGGYGGGNMMTGYGGGHMMTEGMTGNQWMTGNMINQMMTNDNSATGLHIDNDHKAVIKIVRNNSTTSMTTWNTSETGNTAGYLQFDPTTNHFILTTANGFSSGTGFFPNSQQQGQMYSGSGSGLSLPSGYELVGFLQVDGSNTGSTSGTSAILSNGGYIQFLPSTNQTPSASNNQVVVILKTANGSSTNTNSGNTLGQIVGFLLIEKGSQGFLNANNGGYIQFNPAGSGPLPYWGGTSGGMMGEHSMMGTQGMMGMSGGHWPYYNMMASRAFSDSSAAQNSNVNIPNHNLFLRMFRKGEIYVEGDAVVQNFYTDGDFVRTMRHFRALPLEGVKGYGANVVSGFLKGYTVSACSTCGPRGEPMIEFVTRTNTFPRIVRRFLYLPGPAGSNGDTQSIMGMSQWAF